MSWNVNKKEKVEEMLERWKKYMIKGDKEKVVENCEKDEVLLKKI